MGRTLAHHKRIALIAHDGRKPDLVAWVKEHLEILRGHSLSATGTTGRVVEEATGLLVRKFVSGPLGGDQQIGAKIVEGELDALIFFWDPLSAQPHDPDVKALLRIAALYNLPVACNRASADFIVTSPLFEQEYSLGSPLVVGA